MDCREYAIKLLEDNECKLDCYRGVPEETIEKELEEYYKDKTGERVPYPVKEIARALRQIGDEQPIPAPAPYRMIFDMGHTVDGINCDSFEEAVSRMEDTYVLWLGEATEGWRRDSEGCLRPTEKQSEEANEMIETCWCYVSKFNEEEHSYSDVDDDDSYFLPDERLEELGWKEDFWK